MVHLGYNIYIYRWYILVIIFIYTDGTSCAGTEYKCVIGDGSTHSGDKVSYSSDGGRSDVAKSVQRPTCRLSSQEIINSQYMSSFGPFQYISISRSVVPKQWTAYLTYLSLYLKHQYLLWLIYGWSDICEILDFWIPWNICSCPHQKTFEPWIKYLEIL